MLTISTTEMKCYRTILGTSYVECITNDTVWDFITQETSPMEDFIFIMKGKCYGHAIKSNSLSITVLQSSTLGKRKGRQSKKQKNKNKITAWIGQSLTNLDIGIQQKMLVMCSAVQWPYQSEIWSWNWW